MHLVTKILIVFAALFAVLLAALSMAFAFNAQAIRDSVGNERAEKLAAMATLNESQTTAQREIAKNKADYERAAAQLAELNNAVSTLSNERNALSAASKENALKAETAINDSRGKDARLQNLENLVAAVNAENKALRDQHVRMSKEQSDYFVRIGELENNNQVLTQNLRALQEQMQAAKEAGSKAAATPVTARSGVEALAGPLVTARVSKVSKAPSGDDLAFITAGSAAGLKEGQRLNVVRGSQFIAALVIVKADVNEAVGRVDTLGASSSVMADDTVLSRLQ